MTDDFRWLDATAQAELVRTGAASALELVDAAIRRIESENPAINAVITPLFEKARAAAVDAVKGDRRNAPFVGVPFLLKDLIAAYAGVPTRGGSRLTGSRA